MKACMRGVFVMLGRVGCNVDIAVFTHFRPSCVPDFAFRLVFFCELCWPVQATASPLAGPVVERAPFPLPLSPVFCGFFGEGRWRRGYVPVSLGFVGPALDDARLHEYIPSVGDVLAGTRGGNRGPEGGSCCGRG